jgi:hypothetical protein
MKLQSNELSGTIHNTLIAKFDIIFAIAILVNQPYIFALSIGVTVVIL